MLYIKATAQTASTDTAYADISNRALHFIDKKYSKLATTIDKQTLKLVERMRRKEAKLQQKLRGIDSTKAQELFAGTQEKYQQFEKELQDSTKLKTSSPEFISGLDSIQTAVSFIQQKSKALPLDKLKEVEGVSSQLKDLQARIEQANSVEQYIKTREQELKNQLSGLGLAKELLGINKQVFYYRQQLEEYKNIINDKQKLEEAILTKLSELPAFQDFMKHNSYAGRLFSLPSNFSDPASLAGLQTRDQVAQMISQRMGSNVITNGIGNPQQYFQPQIDLAQAQLTNLKNKLLQFGGNSGTVVQPDFKQNSQKTKPFAKRLVYGINTQTQRSTNTTPSISTITFTVGYRLNDKSIVGFGGNYLLGLGHGLNHFKLSHEGAGFRSYLDIKAKGSLWLSGGMEWNYMQSFAKVADLKNMSAWQKSALFGLTKKYKLSKTKESNMQLLFDALYNHHYPRTQPIIFRLGYSFN